MTTEYRLYSKITGAKKVNPMPLVYDKLEHAIDRAKLFIRVKDGEGYHDIKVQRKDYGWLLSTKGKQKIIIHCNILP